MQQGQMTLPTGVTVRDPDGGHYVIETVLSREQTGSVYLVRQKAEPQNRFSLKEIITPTEQERKHFMLEGQLLRHLSHPSLPHVYRSFEHDSLKRVYLLMDYIQGQSLDALRVQQSDQRLSLSLIFSLLSPIVDALIYLHQQNPPILHRNIKPSNIIVPDNAHPPVLIDFGMAKLFVAGTTTGFFKGTLGYAAPEQYMGTTSPRTDVYGLAATFYALLTGTIPPSAVSRLRSTNNDPLKPASLLIPSLSPAIDQALERALSINSDHRYSSIAAFWHDITAEADISSGPLLLAAPHTATIEPAPPPSQLNRDRVPRRWNPFLLLLIALSLLLILLLGVLLTVKL
jgi:serine/threonine protein kinase